MRSVHFRRPVDAELTTVRHTAHNAQVPHVSKPEATSTIAIYYYYSAQKLTLILPSHRG